MSTPEKPILDKPEDEKNKTEIKEPSVKGKKLYTKEGRPELFTEKEKKDWQKRSWDEIK